MNEGGVDEIMDGIKDRVFYKNVTKEAIILIYLELSRLKWLKRT